MTVYDTITFENAGSFCSEDPAWLHPRHTTQTEELIYVTEGTVHLCQDFSAYALSAGDALSIREGKTYYGCRESDGPVKFYRLHYRFGEMQTGGGNIWRETQLLTAADRPRMEMLWKELLRAAETPEYPACVCDSFTRILLAELAVHHVLEAQLALPEAMLPQQIARWLRTEAPFDVRVTDVAEKFGCSTDCVTERFRTFYTKGLKSYIDEVRICRIKRALLTHEGTCTEVAQLVGYPSKDYNNFVKFFKYHTGISPTRFRQLYKNE